MAEGGEDETRRVLLQERGLHGERHVLREATCIRFYTGVVTRWGKARQSRRSGLHTPGARIGHQGIGHRAALAQGAQTSSAMMLPAPSQMELSGISR